MKKFSMINEAKKASKLDIQDDTINYISSDNLKKYMDIASKFISQETKDIINWLIINNKTYLHDLDPSMEADNALAAFYDAGVPKESDRKELYKCIGKVSKNDRLIEIPVFQTKEQFESIINKKISPDEILLDLKSDRGRSKVYMKYQNLIYKIINQWKGKSNLGTDDLLSVANEAMVYAMNTFGKRKVRGADNKWTEEEGTDEKVTKYTFGQYAGYCIANFIREEIKHKSHLVRVPASQQKKERSEKGYNTKNYATSGDKIVGHDTEGKGKSLFDFIDTGEAGGKVLDNDDLDKLWAGVYKKLNAQFNERDLDVFYSLFGLNGHKIMKNKEVAKKYNVGVSTISVVKAKIIAFIRKDKLLSPIFNEILELTHECRNNKYNEEDQFLEAHDTKGIRTNQNNDND